MMKTRTLQLMLIISTFVSPLGRAIEQGRSPLRRALCDLSCGFLEGVGTRRFTNRPRLHREVGASRRPGTVVLSNK
jgi:hypothetical protein